MGCECSAEDKPNRSCALSCATDHTEDLKMVIMVHRHGARHPTKQLGGDLCWPANKQFWESYKAQLTPTGAQPAENPPSDSSPSLDTPPIELHLVLDLNCGPTPGCPLRSQFPSVQQLIRVDLCQGRFSITGSGNCFASGTPVFSRI